MTQWGMRGGPNMDVRPAARRDIPIYGSVIHADPVPAAVEDIPDLRDSLVRQILP